jgi:hypothetical protein
MFSKGGLVKKNLRAPAGRSARIVLPITGAPLGAHSLQYKYTTKSAKSKYFQRKNENNLKMWIMLPKMGARRK